MHKIMSVLHRDNHYYCFKCLSLYQIKSFDVSMTKRRRSFPTPVFVCSEEDRYRPASSQGTFLEEVGGQRLSARTGHRPITGGFVPNSVLLKLLYPQPSSLPEPSTSKPYRPPELTAKQLSEIRALRKVSVCLCV